MGLDMYAFTTPTEPFSVVDFPAPENVKRMFYWRKHPDLHGWMEALYFQKGGASDSFNCDTLLLTSEDLDRLEKDVRAEVLPKTQGFFFGESDETDRPRDLSFIGQARAAIRQGLFVFCYAWW